MPEHRQLCAIDGCNKTVKARGWCSGHYSRWQRNKDVAADTPLNEDHATPSECGTSAKYTSGCRCDPCRQAATEYARNYRTEALATPLAADDKRHGTSSGYVTHRCRCTRCAKWRQNYAPLRTGRARRRARLLGAASEPYTLEELSERDGSRCQLCRRHVNMDLTYPHPKSPSIDHIVPLADGGDDIRRNVQLAHLRCNVAKGTRGTDQLRLVG